jgi:hypothetical protein
VSNEAVGQVAEKADHGLTCNLDGIPSQERARYTELFESLRHAKLERECIPRDGTSLGHPNGPVWLDLKGPEGVKDFILVEFGLR